MPIIGRLQVSHQLADDTPFDEYPLPIQDCLETGLVGVAVKLVVSVATLLLILAVFLAGCDFWG